MTPSPAALLAGVALSALAAPALSQTTSGQAPSTTATRPNPTTQGSGDPPTQNGPQGGQTRPAGDQPAAVESVTVTGRANDIRTSIDSVSYSVGEDLQNATGSLADALRAIPSAEVDPEGNVSLRGDANVTILVDGRPSALFEGQNRGQAVLQIPADQYSRIEVMTNPSAAYRPDGSGGVINLISKPTRTRQGASTTGAVRANVGTGGAYNGGVSFAHTRDRLTISGDLSVRRDTFLQETVSERDRLDTGSNSFIASRTFASSEAPNDGFVARGAVEFRLDERTQLTGEARASGFTSRGDGYALFEFDNAAGALERAFERDGYGGRDLESYGVTGRVVRRFDGAEHEWSNELRIDRSIFYFLSSLRHHYLTPAAPDFSEFLDGDSDNTRIGFTSAYVRPIADTGKLRLGYELDLGDVISDVTLASGPPPAPLVIDPRYSSEFAVAQVTHAGYVTWERPFGQWTAQLGLRLEQTFQDIDQITTGDSVSNDYFRVYPTIHLSYDVGDNQTLRASYSRRVQRPQAFDLNPFLLYVDTANVRSGNPDLKPQETDSFEFTWQRRVDETFYQATLFYRDTRGAFSPVTTDLGGGVFLTRPENLGARSMLGLELVANGRLHPTLRYNASLTLSQQEIDAAGLPDSRDRSGSGIGGRLSLTWQPTQKDFIQLSGLWTGDTLLAQGERQASALYNLGYRRTLTDKLSLQVTVRDLFDNYRSVTVIDTPALRDRNESFTFGRVALIGLTYTFGSGGRRPEQFDFSIPQ